MPKVLKEEVYKIATMSHIDLQEHKIDALIKQLEDVLNYAERVQEIAAEVDEPRARNVNVFREDSSVPFDAQRIMQEAPEREENYFVVPKILDGSR